MGLCLGAQINKQDISKPQQETAGSRGLLTEHRVSLQGAEGPAPTGSRWVTPAGMQLECSPSPLQQTSRTPRSLLCPQSPGQLCQCNPEREGSEFRSSPQAGPELRGKGTASTLLQSSETPGKCALETQLLEGKPKRLRCAA